MNIAFVTSFECCPEIGGTERTTSLVADALKNNYEHHIYSIYCNPVLSDAERYPFDDSLRIKSLKKEYNEITSFIEKNEINLIINQGEFYFSLYLSELIKKENLNCRHIFALHFSPGSLENTDYIKRCLNYFRKSKNLKSFIKIITFPLYNIYRIQRVKKQYRTIYHRVDKVVLLSEQYINQWCQYSNMKIDPKEDSNFIAIPNALTFDRFASEKEILTKEKRILIVARLSETQKRISKALTIWNNIVNNPLMKDWQLDIVGEGSDGQMYRSMVENLKIPRVNFYGRQNPQEFYKRSSIFMMTSSFEGFGMTLIEASQFGVVPFAFNTYLALTDLIRDGENGFVIEPDNFRQYESRILDLVSDDNLRIKIAKNAVENSKRYSMDKIAPKWETLIRELTAK